MKKQFVLTEAYIRFEDTCVDWRDSITKSSEALLKNGFINKQYQNAMIESVNEHGPYIVIAPQIALPHARPEAGSLKVGYSIMRVKQPVAFSEEDMHQVKLFIALSCKDSDTHIAMIQNIVTVLSNDEYMHTLMTTNNKLDIVNIFKEAFNDKN